MTANEIRNGKALPIAVSAEYSKCIQMLALAIDYCTENKGSEAALTEIGQAGFARFNAILAKEQPLQRMPQNGSFDAAEKVLLAFWACMLFYPKLTLDRFAVYAEMNVLLKDMLAGGWFA